MKTQVYTNLLKTVIIIIIRLCERIYIFFFVLHNFFYSWPYLYTIGEFECEKYLHTNKADNKRKKKKKKKAMYKQGEMIKGKIRLSLRPTQTRRIEI
jgi:hypothetical protein